MEQRIYERVGSFKGSHGAAVAGQEVHQEDGDVFEALRGLA
jgi:hypothetical protein